MRVVLEFASSRRGAALAKSAAALLLAAVLHAWLDAPAAADEKTSLENVLLVEQLVDVATTQQLLRSPACAQATPVTNAAHAAIGVQSHCIVGRETDPFARPFVVSPFANTVAALSVNAFLRIGLRGVATRRLRWLRLGVELYPGVIVQTVSSNFHKLEVHPRIVLSMRRRF